MIVKRLEDIDNSEFAVQGDGWRSRRLLLCGDEMGFSVHDTLIPGGTTLAMEYKNHLEAVYCIEGNGTIKDKGTGETHDIAPGTIYALNRHDPHILTATTDMRFVCVFNPPVTGDEKHDANGSYPID